MTIALYILYCRFNKFNSCFASLFLIPLYQINCKEKLWCRHFFSSTNCGENRCKETIYLPCNLVLFDCFFCTLEAQQTHWFILQYFWSVRSEKSISLSLCLQIFFLNLLLYLSFQTLHSFMLATFFLPLSCIYLAFLVFQPGYATSHLAHIIVIFLCESFQFIHIYLFWDM